MEVVGESSSLGLDGLGAGVGVAVGMGVAVGVGVGLTIGVGLDEDVAVGPAVKRPKLDPNAAAATTTTTSGSAGVDEDGEGEGEGHADDDGNGNEGHEGHDGSDGTRLDTTVASLALAAQNMKKVHNEQWNEMLERLKAYRAQHGDCLVPKRFPADPKLGTWVETQRVQFKRLPRVFDETLGYDVPQPNNRLTAERLSRLSELGFCWSAKHIRKASSTGSLTTPSPLTTADANSSFVPAQTLQLSSHSQPPSAIKRYPSESSIHSNTKSNGEAQWEEYYARLLLFKQLHGHVVVPRKYDADPKLALWVESQRALWNRDFNQSKDKPATPHKTILGQEPDPKGLTLERKLKLDELGFVWSLRTKRIDDHWDEMFNQLVEYKNQYGDCLVPSRYEANLKLGKWVETQRYEYTKLQRAAISDNEEVAEPPNCNIATRPANPRLTPERLSRLESIGFEWKVKNKMKRYYDKQWDSMFQQLLDFKQRYGHVNVPKRYPDNIKLGTWVHTQRIQYRKLIVGSTNMPGSKVFPKERSDDDDLPPDGTSTCKNERSSSPSYAFHDETYEGGPSAWTPEQAQSYRLTDERRKRLEEIGFCWSAREGNEKATLETSGRITRNSYDDQWDAMFDLLFKYKEQYGDCLVPKRFTANPKLGTWVDTQRVQYKKMLKKIAQLQHQKQCNQDGQGNQNIVVDDNASIGSTGKESPSNTGTPLVGRLTQERIQRLQNLGFVWSLRDDWAKHYEELKAYKQIHGHCNVPARYAENRRLGIWVSAQRQQFKMLQQQSVHPPDNQHVALDAGLPDGYYFPINNNAQGSTSSDAIVRARRSAPLTQERIDLLNALGFTWTIRSRDSVGESWNQRLHDLRVFKQQFGHCLVPSRYEANPELGIWVGTQRTQYRMYMRCKETGLPISTSMNEDRIRELEELGFVWGLRGSAIEETDVAVESAASLVDGTGSGSQALMGAIAVGSDDDGPPDYGV